MTTRQHITEANLERREPAGGECELLFWRYCRMFELPLPTSQYVAIPGRRFRFDFAWPAQRVLVEVQEETAHGKWRKQSQDAEKLNLAQLQGYIVLQFTGTMLRDDPAGCIKTVTTALAMASESNT